MRNSLKILICILTFSCLVLAQEDTEVPTRVTTQNRTGDLPYTSQVGTDIEHVDFATGALQVHIPLWSVQGRGMNSELSLHWNSNYLVTAVRTDSSGNPLYGYQIEQNSGWQPNIPRMTNTLFTVQCNPGGITLKNTWLMNYIYHDEEGGKHQLAIESGGGQCQGPPVPNNPDLTAAGMWGSPGQVILSNGTLVGGNTSLYEDSNGNFRNNNTDTLGRQFYTETDAPLDSLGRPTQTTYTVKDANGGSQNIVVIWEPLTITTNFQTPGFSQELLGKEWYAIQSITLPNGTAYHFQYEPDYGELTEIDLPTGGVIKYTWANYTYQNLADELQQFESRRYVASRSETVNGVTSTWTFQLSNIPSRQLDKSVVTFPTTLDPSGNPIQNQSAFLSYSGNLLDVSMYAGSVSQHPLREYSMSYGFDEDPYVDPCSAPTALPLPVGARLTRLITILDDGTATKKDYDYDSIQYTFYPNHCGDPTSSNAPVIFTTSRGNVTAIREYGFGAVTGNPGDLIRDVSGAPLLRTTARTYWHDSHSGYVTSNIIDKVSSETVTDNTTNKLASQTLYDYDQTAIVATQNLASVPGHDPNVTSGATIRGNPTHVQHLNNVDNSLITTTYTYGDLGNLLSIIDPNQHTTQWIYNDAFDPATNTCAPAGNSFAYVTKRIDAAGHNFIVTHRACTGQVSSHQNPNDIANGISTTYSYDAMGRKLCKTLPNGGQICNNYNDSAPPSITTTTTATPDPSIIQTEQFDGLKRLVQKITNALECNVVVDTTYDALGHTASVSNPHCATSSSPTDGITKTFYDALARPVTIIQPDSSVVQVAYSGISTTTTDESGRYRISKVDALGRMNEVDEEATQLIPDQPATPPTAATGSVTISGAEQSQQVQTAPPAPSTATITIGGSERQGNAKDCAPGDHCPMWDEGSVTLNINGHPVESDFAQGSTQATVVQNLVNGINAISGMTATSSGSVITFHMTNGSNPSFATGMSNAITITSFTISPTPSGTMTGGAPAQFGPSYDTGTVAVIVNGTTYSTSTGQTSTASSIASSLAAGMTNSALRATSAPCSPVTSTCGATISISSVATGASTDYSLSASASSSLHSFSANASGGSLAGGTNGLPEIPAHYIFSGIWATLYKYDALGNLYCVEQHGDTSGTPCPSAPPSPTAPVSPNMNNPWRLRQFGHNSLGQLLWSSNPETGTITYAYDLNGNIAVKTSPAANQNLSSTTAISFCYDSLNRLLAKGYSNTTPQPCSTTKPYLPNPAVVNNYDETANGIGYLTSLTDQAGSGIYTYDIVGEIKTEQRTIGSATRNMSYDYNLHGGATAIHYPSGAVVNYTNQSSGRPTSAIDSANNINYVTGGPAGSLAKYGPDGSISTMTFGSTIGFAGIANVFFNTPRLQPCRITASSGVLPISCTDTTNHGNILDVSYDFSFGSGDNGNVIALSNFKDASRNQTFTYDSVNRLLSAQNTGTDCSVTTANGKTEYWGNSYSYDAWGNLYQKSTTKCGAEYLSVGVSAFNQLSSYAYDAAGNVTTDTADGISPIYDQENRILSVSKNGITTTYTYDSEGHRVQKSNGTTGTLYWYMAPGVVAESDLQGTTISEYVFFGGQRVARRDGPNGTGGVFYYFSDHLNTASAITDAGGALKSESDYYPWGGELQLTNNDSNHYKFTGKERDTETGLDYFGARYYSNGLGRFVSPDWAAKATAVPYAEFADPQSLNLYTYVRNIPTTRYDSDGHCQQDACLAQTSVNNFATKPKDPGQAAIGALKDLANKAYDTANLLLGKFGGGNFQLTNADQHIGANAMNQILAAAPIVNDLKAATTTAELTEGLTAARGMSKAGGIMSAETNSSGGTVVTAVGKINQTDVAGAVNTALYQGGEINILSGVHGAADGTTVAAPEFYQSDLLRFGDLPGVTVHDMTTLTKAQVDTMVNGPGTTIGGFCDSGACLKK